MTQPPPLHPATQSTPGWWSRNWKWFVPVIGIGGLTLIAGFIALIASLVFGLMKGSEPYETALAQANASAEVREVLGTPITAGFFVTGEINLENAGGKAKLSFPLSGPLGSSTIDVRATKHAGRWHYTRMVVTIAGSGQEIDLTAAANGTEAEAP